MGTSRIDIRECGWRLQVGWIELCSGITAPCCAQSVDDDPRFVRKISRSERSGLENVRHDSAQASTVCDDDERSTRISCSAINRTLYHKDAFRLHKKEAVTETCVETCQDFQIRSVRFDHAWVEELDTDGTRATYGILQDDHTSCGEFSQISMYSQASADSFGIHTFRREWHGRIGCERCARTAAYRGFHDWGSQGVSKEYSAPRRETLRVEQSSCATSASTSRRCGRSQNSSEYDEFKDFQTCAIGFADSVPALREWTIRAMVVVFVWRISLKYSHSNTGAMYLCWTTRTRRNCWRTFAVSRDPLLIRNNVVVFTGVSRLLRRPSPILLQLYIYNRDPFQTYVVFLVVSLNITKYFTRVK